MVDIVVVSYVVSVRSADTLLKALPDIGIEILDKDLVALVAVGFNGVATSVLVISSRNELEVLPRFREETVNVAEVVVVSALTDESGLAGINIDVRSSFPVVVSNFDTLSEISTVFDIVSLLKNAADCDDDSVGVFVDTNL
jgi:hypothetical protein